MRKTIIKILSLVMILTLIAGVSYYFYYKTSNKIVFISAGINNTLIIRENGSVDGVGETFDAKNWKDIIQISSGRTHIVALKRDGTVIATGNNNYGQCEVSTFKDVKQVVAGDSYTVALKKDGRVLVVGKKNDGKNFSTDILNPLKMENIISVSDCQGNFAGVNSIGNVVIGRKYIDKEFEKLNWNEIVKVCNGFLLVGLKSDGTVLTKSRNYPGIDNKYVQDRISKWRDIKSISEGDGFIAGLTNTGKILIAGPNELSNLWFKSILQAETFSNVISISAKYRHLVFLTSDSIIHSVGINEDHDDDSGIYVDYQYQRTQDEILNK